MRQRTRRFVLRGLYLAVVLALTGCFQQASGEPAAPPQAAGGDTVPPAVAQEPSPTADVAVPTEDIPTEAAETTPDVLPTEGAVAQVPTETATIGALAPATDTPEPLVIPTETPTPTPTETPTITPIPAVSSPTIEGDTQGLPPAQGLQEETPLAPATDTLSAPRQTATALVGIDLTADAAATQTAEGPPIVLPTNTPEALPPGETVPPSLPTATGQAPPGDVGTNVQPGTCVHEVVAGDNLFRISQRYNVPIDTIAAANGISNISLIVVGDLLTIPGCNTGGDVGTTPPSGTTCQPGVAGTYRFVHIVDQYENLFRISLQYGVPVVDIAACNNIQNISLIFINQTLYIP